MLHLPPHSTQHELSDSEFERKFCLYGADFALLPKSQSEPIPDELIAECGHGGFVVKVLYWVTGEQAGNTIHIGDVYSAEAAREVVRQLQFTTGHYSRCWEINSRHIASTSLGWLDSRAVYSVPEDQRPTPLFEVLSTQNPRHFGVILHNAPWTDAHLLETVVFDAAHLRELQERESMPSDLIDVLHQAALAESRIVIFRDYEDAPVLRGLALYDDGWMS